MSRGTDESSVAYQAWLRAATSAGRLRRTAKRAVDEVARYQRQQGAWVRNIDERILWDDSPIRGSDAFSQVAAQHDGNLVDKWRHYLPIYDRVLSRFRDGFVAEDGVRRPLKFLEIGVAQGGSQQLWRTYLGPDAVIYGIDIEPQSAKVADPAAGVVRVGSQADPGFLQSVITEMGGVDVVFDDGSHIASHQRISLATLWPHLSWGGVYICEDVHTAYWTQFEGGLGRPGTYVEEVKTLIDDMHRHYHDGEQQSQLLPARDELGAITVFDSLVVLDKWRRPAPTRSRWGRQMFD